MDTSYFSTNILTTIEEVDTHLDYFSFHFENLNYTKRNRV